MNCYNLMKAVAKNISEIICDLSEDVAHFHGEFDVDCEEFKKFSDGLYPNIKPKWDVEIKPTANDIYITTYCERILGCTEAIAKEFDFVLCASCCDACDTGYPILCFYKENMAQAIEECYNECKERVARQQYCPCQLFWLKKN